PDRRQEAQRPADGPPAAVIGAPRRGGRRTTRSPPLTWVVAGRPRIGPERAAHCGHVTSSLSSTVRAPVMGILWPIFFRTVIVGIIGLGARAVMPGKQAMGLGMTIILGVVGAIVGGFIGGLFGGDGITGIMDNPWSLGTILLAVIGAVIVMAIYGLATRGGAR